MVKRNYLEIILVCVFLTVFLFIHSGLFFLNKYRSTFDTFASYSEFYYSINSFRNGTLPLWDPYTHGGQPYHYHFVKMPGGELSVIFFSLISYLFNISILALYHYQVTLHFLVFVFGCFYLARILFPKRIISYYVLLLGLFSPHFGTVMGKPGAVMVIEFLPWTIAFFILFITGKARSFHLFAFVLIFLLFIQIMDSIASLYFLFLFCIVYCIFFRKQLSWPKIHLVVWIFAAFILCLGLIKTFVMFSEISNIAPSLRIFAGTGGIYSGIVIASPLDQRGPTYIRDYLNLLNPLIGRYGGGELKLYLGLIPAFFAFYAIALPRNKFIWTLAIPGALSLWVSFGHKAILSSFCFYALPFLKFIRIMENFGLAPIYISFVFISAFGFESILEKINHLQDLRRFWKHIRMYLWFFIIVGLIITAAYIYHDSKGLIKSLVVLSCYLPPVIGMAFCSYMDRNSQKFRRFNVSAIRAMVLLSAILVLIIALAILSQPFFAERLIFFKMNRLIPISMAFCIVVGYILFFYNKKYSSIITVVCLGITFIDLVLFTGLSTYTRLEKRVDLVVPERVKSFEYQKLRMESFWPSNIRKIYFLRPAMLYLQSSVITKEKFYYQGSLIFSKNREFDFYMLKKFWEAYQRFPERIKRVVMGVDMPKLAFFTDYKEMDDEAVFKECENLDPELLKRFVYLAPNGYEAPSVQKISMGQTSSANIEVEYFDNNRLRLLIDAKESGFLYYSDGYDRNWRCFVDGEQQPIRRANIAFKAVFIPEGRHSVLFVYRPIFYLMSLWLFLAACAICFGSAYWSWMKR